MDYNYISNIEECTLIIDAILKSGGKSLVYYVCLPTSIVSLFVGIFVLFKGKNSLSSWILFLITISFATWAISDFMIWEFFKNDSQKITFFWSIMEMLDSTLFILCIYFTYVFLDNKDIGFIKKILLIFLVLPTVFLSATKLGLSGFNIGECGAIETNFYLNYIFFVEIVSIIWIGALLINRFFVSGTEKRKQILLLGFGITIFLLSFFVSGLISEYLVSLGYLNGYIIEFYGLFGVVIFISFLAYLIVQYGAMDIKLARAQALVWSLIFLIGAQFFFIRNPTNQVLNSIAFVLVCFIGYGVVKSVKREEQQNDRLIHFSKELTRANAELKRLDNAKSEFISIASHQLRTPLTAIKGYISLILEGAYGENADKTDDALNKIFLANERLIQLVEDMLNLTRIESGRLEYHLEDNVQVEDILAELKDMFILRTQDKKLDFSVDTGDAKLPPIKADKSKLREVISNLIDNAIKYTKEGFVRVSAQKDGSIVRITIADSGMGISEESLKTLFAKFSRGTDSTKVYTDGSGLGLYVGKNLIESQGGHIYAESEGVNKGSRFIVEMPIAKGE